LTGTPPAGGVWGCVACGTNVKTCTGSFAADTNARTNPTTTFGSCLTGYFLSAANACDSC